MAMYADTIGVGLLRRFDCTGSLDDLNESIELERKVIALTPENHSNMAIYANTLGIGLFRRFERIGFLDDLNESIEWGRKAITLIPDNHSNMAIYANTLGVGLLRRFGRTGSTNDLNESIELERKAIVLIPDNHSNMATYAITLGIGLFCRFGKTGSLGDLNESIELERKAIALTPESHSNMATYANTLGIGLFRRFERIASLEDLNESIELERKAIALTPDNHSNVAIYADDLGIGLLRRFERTGSLDDLNESIELERKAITLILDNHSNMAMYANTLGAGLLHRFRRTGSLDDLNESIEFGRKAIAMIPDNHSNMARYAITLGVGLFCRFEKTGSLDDLNESIELERKSVALIPDNHPNMAKYMDDLGVGLLRRFEYTGSLDDLNDSIELERKIIKLIPDNHSNIATYANTLGVALFHRFERTGSMDDLNESIDVTKKALMSISDYHPNMAMYMTRLANAYGCQGKYDEAIPYYERALMIKDKVSEVKSIEKSFSKEDIFTADILVKIGLLHQLEGRYEKAISYYKLALMIDKDDQNLHELTSTLGQGYELSSIQEELAVLFPIIFYGDGYSSPFEYPNFLDIPWKLPSLFLGREDLFDDIQNRIALTDILTEDGITEEARHILRADTIGGFISETWPKFGPLILDVLKSLIRALNRGSETVTIQSMLNQINESESVAGKGKHKSKYERRRPTYTFLATSETLLVLGRCPKREWIELCACLEWLYSTMIATDSETFHKTSSSFRHEVLSVKYVSTIAESFQSWSSAYKSSSAPQSFPGRKVLCLPCLISIVDIAPSIVADLEPPGIAAYTIQRTTYVDSESKPIRDDPLFLLCWRRLFQQAGIVSMTLPQKSKGSEETHHGIGLRLSFELMAGLAGTRDVVDRDGGLILTGFATALYPKYFLNEAERSAQWHLVVHDENRKLFRSLHHRDDFETLIDQQRLRVQSLDKVNGIAYIGWSSSVEIVLGTKKNLMKPGPSKLLEAGVKHLKGNQALSLNAQISLPLFNLTVGLAQTFDRIDPRCRYSHPADDEFLQNRLVKHSVIIYDRGIRTAWLCPMLNLIVCIARLYLTDNAYQFVSFSIPVLKAMDGCRRKALDYVRTIWNTTIEPPQKLTFGQLFMRLSAQFAQAYDSLDPRLLNLNSELIGFDIRDFISNSRIIPKKLPVTKGIENWKPLVEDTEIIFCSNLGSAAVQVESSASSCASVGPPVGCDILVCPGYLLKDKLEERGCEWTVNPVQRKNSELIAYQWNYRGNPFECGASESHRRCDGVNCWPRRLQKVTIISRVSAIDDMPRRLGDKVVLKVLRSLRKDAKAVPHLWNFEGGICFGSMKATSEWQELGVYSFARNNMLI